MTRSNAKEPLEKEQTILSGLFRNASIKRKLILAFMAISSVVVLLTGATVVFYQSMMYRQYMLNDCLVQAKMISENCSAAVSFDDPEDAGKILMSLRAKPSVAYASVKRMDDTTFAEYRHKDFKQMPMPGQEAAYRFEKNWLLVANPIILNKKKIGYVFIQSDLKEITAFLWQSMIVTGLIVLGVLMLALLISYRLQRVFSLPVLLLTTAAETISIDKDYSIRANKKNNDEFGTLTDAFNNMMEQIQKNDIEMVHLRNFLKNIIDSMPSILIGVNIQGRVTQ